MKFASNIDFAGNEAQNVVLQNLAAAPSSPKKGQTYFDTAGNVTKVWNGTAWRPTDAAALTDGSIAISALTVDPRARANHTGTQLAATISDLTATITAFRLDQFAAPTANVSFNSKEITNVLDPTAAQSVATKNYVDVAVQNAAAGIDSKPSVRLIATANVALSGLTAIDGVTPAAGDRILVVGQTTASQNGAYVAASGAWARATDADVTGEITPGAFWFVEEGTTYGGSQWRCINTGAITIGTTSVNITQFGATQSISAGNGISITGGVVAVSPKASGGILVDGSGAYVDTSIVSRKYATTITHDGATKSFTITHNLGSTDVQVVVRDSTGAEVLVDNQATTVNTVVVTWSTAQAGTTAFRVIVQG